MPPSTKPPIIQSDDAPEPLSTSPQDQEPLTPTPSPEALAPPSSQPAAPMPSTPAGGFAGMEGMAFFAALMEKLTDKLGALALTPAAMKEILESSGKVTAEMARKAKWPENAEHPHISVYSYPEGDLARPKPKLARTTYFCGAEEQEDRLTPAEIDAYNLLAQPYECRGGSWRAVIKKPSAVGARETLEVYVPINTTDQRMVLPSLLLILSELRGGPKSDDVFMLMAQIETLKALLMAKGTLPSELESALLAAK